jgi:ankyrin repeat protein
VLIEAKADVDHANRFGWTALMWAAYKKHTETVEMLIDAGANLHRGNKNGWTALMLAKNKGLSDIVELLTERELVYALREAVRQNDFHEVLSLLDRGVNVNCVYNGRTALHWAVDKSHAEIVQALLEAGADWKIGDKLGQTPSQLAAQNRALAEARADQAEIDRLDVIATLLQNRINQLQVQTPIEQMNIQAPVLGPLLQPSLRLGSFSMS